MNIQDHSVSNFMHGCETWTMSRKVEEMLDAFERKISR